MSRLFGVILAGGAGSRLGGVRKGDIRIGGRKLIERAAAVFDGHVAQTVVSEASGEIGPGIDGLTVVSDDSATRHGPLAGFRTVARHFTNSARDSDILVFLAVDTPFAPADYVGRLAAAAQETGACFAAWRDNIYPTDSAFRLSTLRQGLEQAPHMAGPKAILLALGAQAVDWSEGYTDDPFANLNRLSDLIALQRRALRDMTEPVRQDS